MEKSLLDILKEISRLGYDLTLYSLAHGPVKLKGWDDMIITTDRTETQIYKYDKYGRLSEFGQCLLYPSQTEMNWMEYYKKCVLEIHSSKLEPGEVCLVKASEMSQWILAVFVRRTETGDFIAKTGKDNEQIWEGGCISWPDNKHMLGREAYPDWWSFAEIN